MRTFRFRDDKSAKFWNIELQGSAFTVRFGRSGTKGQTKSKSFRDEATARKEHDKLVQEKLAKGYQETTPAPAPASTPLGEALEAALVENPDDLAAHSAYADYLQEQGDPRGEFIQVQLAREDPACSPEERQRLGQRERELLRAHAREWLGPLAPFVLDQQGAEPALRLFGDAYRASWARGWVDGLEVRRLAPAFAGVCRDHPLLRLLRRLLVRSPREDGDSGLAELSGATLLRNLRFFQVGAEEGECHIDAPKVVSLIQQMPRLEELRLYAHRIDTRALFALPLPRLRVLVVDHLRDYPLDVLGRNASLGRLANLSFTPHFLEPGDEGSYLPLPAVRALVWSPHLTGLTHLALRQSDLGDEGCEEIVRSGILRRLKVLDLQSGRITDAGALALAACPDLRRLEQLNVALNGLTQAGIDALGATGVSLEAGGQRTAEAIAEGWHLYEGDME
jgi:uncharacterized protein (TIGR02996 family)